MRKIAYLLALSLIFCGIAAQAEDLSYTYGEVSYKWTHPDEEGIGNSNGLETKLSYSPIEYFAIEGGYDFASYKVDGISARSHEWTYGGLGYFPLSCSNNFHGLARVGGIAEHEKISGVGNRTVNGVYAGGGLRYLFDNNAEAEGNITYSHVEDSSAIWDFEAAGLYPIVDHLALKASAAIDNSSDVALTGGLRYSF